MTDQADVYALLDAITDGFIDCLARERQLRAVLKSSTKRERKEYVLRAVSRIKQRAPSTVVASPTKIENYFAMIAGELPQEKPPS